MKAKQDEVVKSQDSKYKEGIDQIKQLQKLVDQMTKNEEQAHNHMKRNKELEIQIAQLSKSNAELESIKDSQQEMIGDYQTKFEFILDENAKLQDKVSDS